MLLNSYIRGIIYISIFVTYWIPAIAVLIATYLPFMWTVVVFGHIKCMSTVVRSGNTMSGVCLYIASRVVSIDEQETES